MASSTRSACTSASRTRHRQLGERAAHERIAREPDAAHPGDDLLEVAPHAPGRELDVALVGERFAHDLPGAVLRADALLDRHLDAVEVAPR